MAKCEYLNSKLLISVSKDISTNIYITANNGFTMASSGNSPDQIELIRNKRLSYVYKITFPNGKIYIGQDITGTFRYFGSWDCDLVAADFTAEEIRDLTLRKQILWESWVATKREVTEKEVELIREYRSNDPAIGYNKWPKFKEN